MATDPILTADKVARYEVYAVFGTPVADLMRSHEALRTERDALIASLLTRADEWDQYSAIVRDTEGGAISREHEFRCQVFEAHASQLRELAGEVHQ